MQPSALLVLALGAAGCLAADPVVQTPLGLVQGVSYAPGARYPGAGTPVEAFFGIPYAEPPRRFAPASPKRPWAQMLNASSCGPKCPQLGHGMDGGARVVGAEDCLFLNVYRPRGLAQPAAVLVWIHGGGFVEGSACEPGYDGASLAVTQNVVVVSINYRLGPLGFLQSAELSKQAGGSLGGLNGIHDQVVALGWVQQNAASFGGDPNAVTVWGESAGGNSVAILVASPLAKGLFHKAVISSGAAYGVWSPQNVTAGLEASAQYMKLVGADSVSQLRASGLDQLLIATVGGQRTSAWFGQAVSVDGAVLTRHPGLSWQEGAINVDALMLGVDTADGLLEYPYTPILTGGPLLEPATSEEVVDRIWDRNFGSMPPVASSEIRRQYPLARYSNSVETEAFIPYRDRCVICPNQQMARWAVSAHIPTWVFFAGSNWTGGQFSPSFNRSYGQRLAPGFIPHGLELGYLFGSNGGVPNPHFRVNSSAVDSTDLVLGELGSMFYSKELCASMQNYLGSFVRSGKPVDPSTRIEWPAVANTSGLPGHMYFAPGQVEWMGGPKELSFTEADCALWDVDKPAASR